MEKSVLWKQLQSMISNQVQNTSRSQSWTEIVKFGRHLELFKVIELK